MCQSGNAFGACCGPLLAGDRNASTAEQLMRSRFTAFALNDPDYLLKSWHPSTRPATLELDPALRWFRLEIGHTLQGGIFDDQGVVAFRAHYRRDGQTGTQYEVSRFVRDDGRWCYLGPSE